MYPPTPDMLYDAGVSNWQYHGGFMHYLADLVNFHEAIDYMSSLMLRGMFERGEIAFGGYRLKSFTDEYGTYKELVGDWCTQSSTGAKLTNEEAEQESAS